MGHDCVYQMLVQEGNDLRQQLTDTWHCWSQSIVDDAIEKWRKRLQARVNKKEDILKSCCSN